MGNSVNEPLVLGKTSSFFHPPCCVEQKERRSHMYVIGTTTKGKSKLLEHCLFQDITQGRGAGLIDPHGDLADDIIRYLLSSKPKHLKKPFFDDPANAERIVYLDPTRRDYIIPFNPLIRQTGETDYDLAADLKEAFQRVWSDSLKEAPQFSNIFLNSLLVLLANNLTLLELQRLLTDRDYREHLLQSVRNPAIAMFFHNRYDKWGREAPLMIESTLNKVSAFTLNDQLMRILGQQRSLNLRKIMDDGGVLIVNLGDCSEETAKLLGSLLAVKLQQSAQSRRDIGLREHRRPFYLYMDEFQNFVSSEGGVKTFSRLLSEAAKFGLHLILAHQTQSQLDYKMRGAIGNIGLKVVFGVEREDAEYVAKGVFSPDVSAVKEEAKTETQHSLYDPLSNQWETFTQMIDKKSLPARHAYVLRQNREAVRIKTIDVLDRGCSEKEVELVKKYSAVKWGTPLEQVEDEIFLRSQWKPEERGMYG